MFRFSVFWHKRNQLALTVVHWCVCFLRIETWESMCHGERCANVQLKRKLLTGLQKRQRWSPFLFCSQFLGPFFLKGDRWEVGESVWYLAAFRGISCLHLKNSPLPILPIHNLDCYMDTLTQLLPCSRLTPIVHGIFSFPFLWFSEKW